MVSNPIRKQAPGLEKAHGEDPLEIAAAPTREPGGTGCTGQPDAIPPRVDAAPFGKLPTMWHWSTG